MQLITTHTSTVSVFLTQLTEHIQTVQFVMDLSDNNYETMPYEDYTEHAAQAVLNLLWVTLAQNDTYAYKLRNRDTLSGNSWLQSD